MSVSALWVTRTLVIEIIIEWRTLVIVITAGWTLRSRYREIPSAVLWVDPRTALLLSVTIVVARLAGTRTRANVAVVYAGAFAPATTLGIMTFSITVCAE
jgi:hypothetical protein